MSQRLYCLFITVGFILTSLSPLAFAKKAKSKPGDFLQLVSVDSNKVTVADQAGNDAATYAVTQLTTIIVNGQPGKLSDLRKGMHLNLSLIEGGKAVSKIDATTASPPKKKAN